MRKIVPSESEIASQIHLLLGESQFRCNVSLPGTVGFTRNESSLLTGFNKFTNIKIDRSRLSRHAHVLHNFHTGTRAMAKSHHGSLLCFYICSATFATITPQFMFFMIVSFIRFILPIFAFLFGRFK